MTAIGLGLIDRKEDLERVRVERIQAMLVPHLGEIVPCEACNATGKKGFRLCRDCGGQGKVYATGAALPMQADETQCFCHMHEGPLPYLMLMMADCSFFSIRPDGSLLPELCREYTAKPKRNQPPV